MGAGSSEREACPGDALGVPSGLVGTIYTQSNSSFMENLILADFSSVHVNMWWIGPMWPKCAFGDQKGLIWKKKPRRLAILLIIGHEITDFSKIYFFLLLWVKRGVLGQRTMFWVFWTKCDVADLTQRQGITTMDD